MVAWSSSSAGPEDPPVLLDGREVDRQDRAGEVHVAKVIDPRLVGGGFRFLICSRRKGSEAGAKQAEQVPPM